MNLKNALLPRAVTCCLVAAGLSIGCSKQPPSVHYDLAQDAALAQWIFPDGERVLVTPVLKIHPRNRALRAQAEGDEPVGPRFEASVFIDWTDLAPRTAVLDLEAPTELSGAEAVVSLNRDEIEKLVLAEGRRRYPVALPEPSQRPGLNRLRVAVDAPEPLGEDDADPELPALLHGVAVGRGESTALAALIEEQAPVFDLARSAGVPALGQSGPSAVRYAIRLPEDAELRFKPRRADGGGDPVLRVTLQAEGGEEQELWSGPPVSEAAEEIAVALPGREGELAWLSLHVGGAGAGSYATGRWAAPRVMGRGQRQPLRATRLSEEYETAGEDLREALADSNVLVLVLDAAVASHFGCYGYERATTPEIDRLAAEGVVFERAYTPAPFTIAAMASAWTSQYPDQHHHGVRHNAPLPKERLTVAEVVSAQGLDTAGFVSNPSAGRPFGLDRGFETFEHLYESDQPGFGGVPRAEEFHPAVEAWLGSRQSGRFLAYVHYLEPHFPYDPPPPFDTRFGPDAPLSREVRRDDTWIRSVNDGKLQATSEELEHLVRLYDGNLAYVDQELGRLRAALEAAGVWDETVVILTSDHGEGLFEHGFIGHGFQLFEESIRVPLIIRFPAGKGPSGKRVEGLVDLLDIAPTIADIFGRLGKGGTAQAFEGRSLLAVLDGAPTKQAVLARTMAERPAFALSDGAYKLIHSLKHGGSELYDLGSDPTEEQNLAERHPIRTELYRQALYRWLRALRREGGTAGSEALTPQELETLKALGYVS